MKQIIATFLTLLLIITLGFSQVRLPKYISDGMVLQRDQPIKIWGFASPDEKVMVRFAGKEYTSVAQKDSTWSVMLPLKWRADHTISISKGTIRSWSKMYFLAMFGFAAVSPIWNYPSKDSKMPILNCIEVPEIQ